jgi:type I restriction enzyme S subunit
MTAAFVSLGSICQLLYGKSLPTESRAGGDAAVYGSNGIVGSHNVGFTSGTTIVIGRKGSIGEVCWSDKQCWPIDTTYYIDSTVTNADLRWMYWLLKSLQLQRMNKSAAVPGLNREDVYRLKIHFPPIHEQKRIAAILDKADEIRKKRELAISKLDQLAQSVFVEMFGDPVANDRNWPLKALGDLCMKIGSGSTPTGGEAAYKPAGVTLIRSMNVHDGNFRYKNLAHIDDMQAEKLRNVNVVPDDVLLNITGASVARVCRAPFDVSPAVVNQHVMILRPTVSLDPYFLEGLLLNTQMKSKLLSIGGSGATREAITKAQAEALQVICPPSKQQRSFRERIQKIAEIKVALVSAEGCDRALEASLANSFFNAA